MEEKLNVRGLPRSGDVLDRATGEVLLIAKATTERLAKFLDNARELESVLREERIRVSDEVVRRMDREASWTIRCDGFELKAPSPDAGTTYYDPLELEEALRRLRRQGAISKEAALAALSYEVQVERKPRQAGIRALLKVGGEVAAAVAECEREKEEPPRRYTRVRRLRADDAPAARTAA